MYMSTHMHTPTHTHTHAHTHTYTHTHTHARTHIRTHTHTHTHARTHIHTHTHTHARTHAHTHTHTHTHTGSPVKVIDMLTGSLLTKGWSTLWAVMVTIYFPRGKLLKSYSCVVTVSFPWVGLLAVSVLDQVSTYS